MGDRLTVTVEAVAHGGSCVGRHHGQVVFVRHALPGEQVVVQITAIGPKGRYLRADVVEVIHASVDRVEPPCRYAGSCGGCDWQHASLPAQRRLKAAVVAEQLDRLGRVNREVEVQELAGHPNGLGWRTRVSYAVDPLGRPGFRRHRSHEVLAVDDCLIAHPLVREADVTGQVWPEVRRIEVVASTDSGEVAISTADSRPQVLTHRAAGRPWQVSGGFWQVHPAAADTLVAAVLEQLSPRTGEHAIDLYAGVGLFAGAVAAHLGPGGRVDVVEEAQSAAADAAANLADVPTVHVHRASVDRFLARTALRRCDLVVLDPPRSGAGRSVLTRVTRLGPRAISYVACDPAALGRDVAYLRDLGYDLVDVGAFDLFPMTHHVECVARFAPRAEVIS